MHVTLKAGVSLIYCIYCNYSSGKDICLNYATVLVRQKKQSDMTFFFFTFQPVLIYINNRHFQFEFVAYKEENCSGMINNI